MAIRLSKNKKGRAGVYHTPTHLSLSPAVAASCCLMATRQHQKMGEPQQVRGDLLSLLLRPGVRRHHLPLSSYPAFRSRRQRRDEQSWIFLLFHHRRAKHRRSTVDTRLPHDTADRAGLTGGPNSPLLSLCYHECNSPSCCGQNYLYQILQHLLTSASSYRSSVDARQRSRTHVARCDA